MRRFSRETQRNYLRDIGRLATLLGRSLDAATADDLRRFQIEQQDDGVPIPTMTSIVSALRFFFTQTLDRPDLARSLTDMACRTRGRSPSSRLLPRRVRAAGRGRRHSVPEQGAHLWPAVQGGVWRSHVNEGQKLLAKRAATTEVPNNRCQATLLILNPDLWHDLTGCKNGERFATKARRYARLLHLRNLERSYCA